MRVGTRFRGSMLYFYREDHPHACGDKITRFTDPINRLGSSPCVWGQAAIHFITKKPGRIIPMRVGTRLLELTLQRAAKDHPHACGDKTKEIKENSGFAKSTA